MTDEFSKTIRLQRSAGVNVDDDGSSTSDSAFEEAEFELVSTQMLDSMLVDNDDRREDLEAVAQGKEGILARNVENDRFEIIDESEVENALAADGEQTAAGAIDPGADDEPFSLVSTVVLNRMLSPEEETEETGETPDDEELANFKHAGFDPYNSG